MNMKESYMESSVEQLEVAESQQVKEILKNKDGNYLQLELPSCLKKLFGDGLVAIRDGKWIYLRKLDNHASHGEGLRVFFFFLLYFSL
ncbi:hypothetical protein DKX38_011052 [Salix brachista]|uniref:Uncharacterized protein n=1 Tax=Salix brachista TaxID=2182728 RepID=A0A5N5M0D2_9ROSI|nr:hypothetical protein DKX38_011052 [Salix brachista]